MPRPQPALVLTWLLCCAAWGCEGTADPSASPDPAGPVSDASDSGAAAQAARPGWALEPLRSPLAQQCLDLVAGQSFAEAIGTCGQALLEDGANPEIEAALADARSIVGDAPDASARPP